MTSFKIWIDADACPKAVKEVTFKFSSRMKISVVMVANSYLSVPEGGWVTSIQVGKGDDVADFYIVEHVGEGDIVITADIPLAGQVIEKGAIAIGPRGDLYTQENISERLSVRDFMKDLRDSGVNTGGPLPYGLKDKEKFTNVIHKLLVKKAGKGIPKSFGSF